MSEEKKPSWDERYATGETPWDTNVPSAELLRVLGDYKIEPCQTLELGCGTGTNAVMLAQKGFRVTAFDLSPLAIEKANARAAATGANVDFMVGDVFYPPDFPEPFPFVFDRGVYHCVRGEGVDKFLKLLRQVTSSGSLYVTLAGNANDSELEFGPPRVTAEEIAREFSSDFDLVQLREFRFDPVIIEGVERRPLGWSVVCRRK